MRLESRIPRIIAEAEHRASLVVQKTAYDIEAGAKVRSRVDTGFMRGSWHTTVHGPLEAEVSNGAHYAIFHEYGTERMSAQPMMTPAVEQARGPFERAMRQVYQ